jgi:hypothetical protein
VTATAGANQATVSWTAPAGNISSYLVIAYSGATRKNAMALGGTSTSATISGLQGGTSYTFQVSATNSIGAGPGGTSNAVTPTGPASTYASTVLADGPAAYYRLDDPSGTIAADSSSLGNAGRYAGGFTQNVAGALAKDPDGATLLDGSSGNIRAANSAPLSITGEITVEVWVKWTAAPTTQDIINKGDGATVAGSSYALAYVPGCGGCGLGFYTYIGNGFTCACQANALAAGSWFHLVGTRSAGGQLSFYVNGSLMATANDGGGALNKVPSGLGIGASGSGTGSALYPSNAAIDDAAVYPAALTATQVSTHYHAAGY